MCDHPDSEKEVLAVVHTCKSYSQTNPSPLANTDLGCLSLRARPSLTRMSAMLTRCPSLLVEESTTGTGRSSVDSWKTRGRGDVLEAGRYGNKGEVMARKKREENLDGHKGRGSGQVAGHEVTGRSCPGGLAPCWSERENAEERRRQTS